MDHERGIYRRLVGAADTLTSYTICHLVFSCSQDIAGSQLPSPLPLIIMEHIHPSYTIYVQPRIVKPHIRHHRRMDLVLQILCIFNCWLHTQCPRYSRVYANVTFIKQISSLAKFPRLIQHYRPTHFLLYTSASLFKKWPALRYPLIFRILVRFRARVYILMRFLV
jgi:hypothetical protein